MQVGALIAAWLPIGLGVVSGIDKSGVKVRGSFTAARTH